MSYRSRKAMRAPVGAQPGIVIAGEDALPTNLSCISFSEDEFRSESGITLERASELQVKDGVTWLLIEGLADVDVLNAVASHFGLHALAMEDVVSIPQRSKLETFSDHLFFISHIPSLEQDDDLVLEQISLFFNQAYVIMFRERTCSLFEPLVDRLRTARGRIRQRRGDYLAYAIIDSVVDSYFAILDGYHEDLEDIEDEVIERPSNALVEDLIEIRREVLELRRVLNPTRLALEDLASEDMGITTEDTRIYLRDAIDHAHRLIETLEATRENALNMMQVYMTVSGQQMNEIMKVLTVMSTIFIPLSFITGLYGMNFDTSSPYNLPELEFAFGYPVAVLVMVTITGLMLYYFKRKRWL